MIIQKTIHPKDDNKKDDVPSSAIERPFPETLKGKKFTVRSH